MKFSALCLAGFAAGAFGKCIAKPCRNKCVAAVVQVGEAFCSSYLSLGPATETVTQTATITSVQTSIETSLDVVTLTTLTTTITAPGTTIYAKREVSSAAPVSPELLGQCGNAAASISSACNCILSTTSTVTVTATATATAAAEATGTTTETITTGATATEYATPTVTVTQPIVNGNFESYLTTGNIQPWTTGGTGGRIENINGVNPCTSTYCSGGRVVVRAYPPTAGGGYVSLQEAFTAGASATYSLSFMYRCLNYDASSRIDVYFQGAKIGSANGCVNSAAFSRVTSGIQFTTDATGAGLLEVRFVNPSNLPYLYFYADDFQAARV